MTDTHVIQLSIHMDTNRIQEMVEKQATEQIISEIREEVEKTLFAHSTYHYRSDAGHRIGYSDFVEDAFGTFLENNKADIVERAAQKLVESVKRSKAWKDKVDEAL